ncbi:MAG: hypothetical protein KJP03_03945, partial [Gammaproteobacteria bacterium]|nr:hypothetical protein [Gammaproteobacteria bacterium]
MIGRPKSVLCLLPVIGSLLIVSTEAGAADHNEGGRSVSLTPHVGLRLGGTIDGEASDTEYELDDSSSYGLTLSIPWEADTDLEFWYSRQRTDVDLTDLGAGSAVDLDLDFYHLGGTLLLEPRGDVVPFVVFTAGATRISSPNAGIDSDTFPSFALGGGWQFFPKKRLGLRLEGRVLGTYIYDDSNV